MKEKKMRCSYSIVRRIDFIREKKIFTLRNYMKMFEISRRTAFRDFEFLQCYRPCKIKNIGSDTYEFSEQKFT